MQTPWGQENPAASTCLIALLCMVCFQFSSAFPKLTGSTNNSSRIQRCQPSPALPRTCMWKVSRHWYLAVCGVCTWKRPSGCVWLAATGSQTGSSLQKRSKKSLGNHCWGLLLHVLHYTSLYMIYMYTIYYICIYKVHIYSNLLKFTELRRYACLPLRAFKKR